MPDILVIGDIQVNTTMKYYLIPSKMTIIKKETGKKMVSMIGRNWNTQKYCWSELKMVWLL